MDGLNQQDISKFIVTGINYKKSDAAIRGQFAVSPATYAVILEEAKAAGLSELFILSTCNRTEIYGLAPDANALSALLCKHTSGNTDLFRSLAYGKQGLSAIEHLFHVSAGLDSQILGDYEIVGQIKQAVKFARDHECIGAFTERLFNAVLQSSKTIKNQTELSGGTVSVSFSAVQFIRDQVKNIEQKKILLVGTGKIGRSTCRNLVDYLGAANVTLINRTDNKASALAAELGLSFAPFEALREQVRASDIILVATNAEKPTILASDLRDAGSKLLIDLSIPYNVDASAKEIPGVTVVNVDELSKLKDKTLYKRKAEVPKALAIIADHVREFLEWHDMRRHVPVLRAVKNKLREIQISSLMSSAAASGAVTDEGQRIQKVINGMAVKMRERNQRGCHYIEAINEFMTTG